MVVAGSTSLALWIAIGAVLTAPLLSRVDQRTL